MVLLRRSHFVTRGTWEETDVGGEERPHHPLRDQGQSTSRFSSGDYYRGQIAAPICVYGEGQVAQPGESLAKPRPQGKLTLLPAGLRGTSPALDLETKCRKSALESFPV